MNISAPDFALPPLHSQLALDSREGRILRIHAHLEATQWWSPERMHRWQMERVDELLVHARRHVPFYAEESDDGLDPAMWSARPLLSKAQVRAAGAALHSRHLPASFGRTSTRTSGSTGVPLEIIQTTEFWHYFFAAKLRLLGWFGCDLREKTVEILPPSGAPQADAVRYLPHGELPFSQMFGCGPYLRVSIFTNITWQLDLLEREAPQYLLTQPSNLRLLLRELRRSGRRLPSLKLVRTKAEQFDPELREECQAVLGVPVHDVYGATEAGYIAIQCPEHDHYHVQSELNLVEVLDKDGRPCAPGEIGRIVVTPLHALAMPLFRYELDDYAEVGASCPCGRGQPVLRRIYGRHKELLTLPSGEKRYSTFGSRVFAGIPAVAQFQIAQTSLTDIEARVVVEQPLSPEQCEAIVAGLGRQIGPEFRIRLVFMETIPRTPGGKYMEFLSEIGPTG